MKYSYHLWHSYFLKRAQDEIANLRKLFPKAKIEHFGSTAVKGLGGKGIIDLSISVSPNELEKTFQQINSTDWDYRPSGGVPNERIFFQKIVKYPKGGKQLFHLHLTRHEDQNMIECFLFRDFLASHPNLANEYSEIKHKAVIAAKKYNRKADKKKIYMETKKPVIENILKVMRDGF